MNELKTESPQEQMIRRQVIARGIREERVIEALRQVPRDRFFPTNDREEAFSDRAAPIGHGQTISQPYMVALMTEKLEIGPEDRVLELGTGSGYQTAILAHLAKEVYTVERVKPLLDAAWERLMELNLRNIHYRHGDGTQGWPEAGPFDRLLITAGAPALPEHLLRTQLKDGGLAVVPVGPYEEQTLLQVRRLGERFQSTELCACRFVKLIGQEGWQEGQKQD